MKKRVRVRLAHEGTKGSVPTKATTIKKQVCCIRASLDTYLFYAVFLYFAVIAATEI